MKTILIRTNFNKDIGLGHLFRMKRLAERFSKKNKIIFILDKKELIAEKILKFQCLYLYKGNKKFTSEALDAKILNERMNKIKIDLIIIDDYRLKQKWQNFFYKKTKIVVFDDNNKSKQKCHILVDSKWDQNFTDKRYLNLVPKKTIRLLGPQYAITEKKNKIKKKRSRFFNILFYVGGSGNLKIYKNFFNEFLKKTKKNSIYRLNIVVGPLANGLGEILKIAQKSKNINIIYENLDINNKLPNIDLYLGVSSSIIYELNNYNIPSILFSTSDNQENSNLALNDLGFYFLLKQKNLLTEYEKVVRLVFSIIKNIDRVRKFSLNKIKIDGKGSNRIIFYLMKLINGKKITLKSKQKLLKKNFIEKNGFHKIEDNHLNFYLISRNLKSNRKNSVNQKNIQNIDHYLWWLNNKISAFYFVREKKIRVYLYHKIIKIRSKPYYYGGWFKGINKVLVSDIISVVFWQISNFKKYKWLAIIKKKNTFVHKLNLYLGFKKISFKSQHRSFFKRINLNNYYLLTK